MRKNTRRQDLSYRMITFWRARVRNTSVTWYVARRFLALAPQLLAISVFTFLLVRFLPGDPAKILLGPHQSPAGVQSLRQQMGLDKPLIEQYVIYLENLYRGDMGRSWFTGEPVLNELLRRAPATMELVFYSMLVAIFLGLTCGLYASIGRKSVFQRTASLYIRFAGSLPDFFVALFAIYLFYFLLDWVPAPIGRMGPSGEAVVWVTGFLTIDTLIEGRFDLFYVALRHLTLPVLTLGFVLAPMVGKVTRAATDDARTAEFIRYARACGLRETTILFDIVRAALPPIVTLCGILFAYLLGGAVLMEKVFSWGGVGQYAVQAILNSDYAAIQGFVLLTASFTMAVYLIVDLINVAIDPRVSLD